MPGDLVLKKLLPVRKNTAHGKLGPNWEGPYIITRVVRPGNIYSKQKREKSCSTHGMRNILSVFTSRPRFVMINNALSDPMGHVGRSWIM